MTLLDALQRQAPVAMITPKRRRRCRKPTRAERRAAGEKLMEKLRQERLERDARMTAERIEVAQKSAVLPEGVRIVGEDQGQEGRT